MQDIGAVLNLSSCVSTQCLVRPRSDLASGNTLRLAGYWPGVVVAWITPAVATRGPSP